MKMHLNLATRDLDASVAFYRTLLQSEPAKHYADYALFLTESPGLELALDLDMEAKVLDPDGRRCETYYVVAETAERDDAGDACCANDETEAELVRGN